MKIADLQPAPGFREEFKLSQEKFIPAASGCYVLTSIYDDILYMGLTDNLQRRFGEHLKDPKKTAVTAKGKAIYFYWLKVAELETKMIERTWMNEHIAREAGLPILNSNYSPT